MLEWHILMLEVFSTILFSLEYFLYKKRIKSLEKVFVIRMQQLSVQSIKGSLKAKKTYQSNLKVNIFRLLFSIISTTLFGYITMLPPFSILSFFLFIVCLIYLMYAFINFAEYYVTKVQLFIVAVGNKYILFIKKGALVGLGVLILAFTFIGKLLNILDIHNALIEVFTYLLVLIAMMYISLVWDSYYYLEKYKKV